MLDAMGDSKWQPIETAPKDGSWLLLFSIYHDDERASWVTQGAWMAHENGWYTGGNSPDVWTVTHWMPLPVRP